MNINDLYYFYVGHQYIYLSPVILCKFTLNLISFKSYFILLASIFIYAVKMYFINLNSFNFKY